MKQFALNLLFGFLIGACLLIPGMSAGTVIILLGIYGALIGHLNGFYRSRENFIKAFVFLTPLAIGGTLGAWLASGILLELIERFSLPLFALFAGLIAGVIPFIFKSTCEDKLKWWYAIPIIIAGAIIIALALLNAPEIDVQDLDVGVAVLVFVAGAVTAASVIIPGISGSFILILMGLYTTLLTAIDTINIPVIAIFITGLPVGLLAASKGIGYFLKNFRVVTYLTIVGFLLGSVVAVFIIPETYQSATNTVGIVCAVALFVVGFISTLIMSKFRKDKNIL